MDAVIRPHVFGGTVRVPASKSHTIRRLIMAAFCGGAADIVSRIENPLDSLDAKSCAEACRVLGAGIEEERGVDGKLNAYIVSGIPLPAPQSPAIIDVGNSGTTL
jgi:3-phosphoshikimate 1-carboxyvinyltransferase